MVIKKMLYFQDGKYRVCPIGRIFPLIYRNEGPYKYILDKRVYELKTYEWSDVSKIAKSLYNQFFKIFSEVSRDVIKDISCDDYSEIFPPFDSSRISKIMSGIAAGMLLGHGNFTPKEIKPLCDKAGLKINNGNVICELD